MTNPLKKQVKGQATKLRTAAAMRKLRVCSEEKSYRRRMVLGTNELLQLFPRPTEEE